MHSGQTEMVEKWLFPFFFDASKKLKSTCFWNIHQYVRVLFFHIKLGMFCQALAQPGEVARKKDWLVKQFAF